MLIVCPSCATSYMIDPASVGPAGRTVRCARCKETWFAGAPKTDVNAFVDSVIAEAEADNGKPPVNPRRQTETAPPRSAQAETSDDFGGEREDEPPPSMPQAAPFAVPPAAAEPEHMSSAPEPVAIHDAPSLVPPLGHAPMPSEAGGTLDSEDIETFAARRKRLQSRRKKSRKSSRWTALILVLFAANVALVGARNEVVRFLPQTASLFAAIGLPVNLRNLKFDNVRISRETENGVGMLVVEGTIVSTSNKPTEVPRLRFAARNASGQEVYTWTARPDRSILGPGESLPFSSHLPSPPADASDVMVRFFTAQDAAAGGK